MLPTARTLSTALLAALIAAHALPSTAAAQNGTPAQPAMPETPAGSVMPTVLAALNDRDISPLLPLFNEQFMSAVSPEQLAQIAATLRDQLFAGAPITVDSFADGSTDRELVAVVTSDATKDFFRLVLQLDADDRIAGLLIQPAPDLAEALASFDQFGEALSELPGITNAGIYELTAGGIETVYEHNPDAALALGSSFKLWILLALAEKIDADPELTWQTQIPIQLELKSLPSGEMQNLPSGTERPLATYALKMISISDNTATDHLLAYVGRENVEEVMARHVEDADRNIPFLATREMFRLKIGPDDGLDERYLAADTAERRRILAEEVAERSVQLERATAWMSAPKHIDTLEWFATPKEMARTFAALAALMDKPGMEPLVEALTTNPGAAFDPAWDTIAFKGGSEPGVVNFSWMLTHTDGRRFVISTAWNNPDAPVDLTQHIGLPTAAAKLLGQK